MDNQKPFFQIYTFDGDYSCQPISLHRNGGIVNDWLSSKFLDLYGIATRQALVMVGKGNRGKGGREGGTYGKEASLSRDPIGFALGVHEKFQP